jgi:alkanesulfonate monooxygenase SsuD/methylene tetrahydromethanopterin reductase-like flavin-dependent oxidoreductase (luciferase family)
MERSPPNERTGVALRDPLPWGELASLAATAEDTGYEALLVPEIAGREAFSTLAALAGETSRLGLGTGVVTVTARGPLTTAMAGATVQERSGGRFVLGLGSGRPGPGALDRVRRYVADLRDAFAGRSVAHEGRSSALALDPGAPTPIWLAALGPHMVELAGEVADGVVLNWCTPERVAEARAEAAAGAARAGRDPAAFTVAVYVRACLGLEEDVATAALLEAAGTYASMPHYRRRFEAMGLGGEPSEALVRAVCLLGDLPAARRRLGEYREAGADLPVVYPVAALDPVASLAGTVLALAPSPALER